MSPLLQAVGRVRQHSVNNQDFMTCKWWSRGLYISVEDDCNRNSIVKHTKVMSTYNGLIHTTAGSIPIVTHSTGAVVTANRVSTHSINITHVSTLNALINICRIMLSGLHTTVAAKYY